MGLKTTRGSNCPKLDKFSNEFLKRTMIGNNELVKEVNKIREERMKNKKTT